MALFAGVRPRAAWGRGLIPVLLFKSLGHKSWSVPAPGSWTIGGRGPSSPREWLCVGLIAFLPSSSSGGGNQLLRKSARSICSFFGLLSFTRKELN